MIEGDKVICIHDIDNIYDNQYVITNNNGIISDELEKLEKIDVRKLGKVPLTIGKTYKVIHLNRKYCLVENDINEFLWYDISLFITISEYRENKLQILLK